MRVARGGLSGQLSVDQRAANLPLSRAYPSFDDTSGRRAVAVSLAEYFLRLPASVGPQECDAGLEQGFDLDPLRGFGCAGEVRWTRRGPGGHRGRGR